VLRHQLVAAGAAVRPRSAGQPDRDNHRLRHGARDRCCGGEKPNPISEPPVLSSDDSSMAVALRDPVQINANVPSQVALSPLQLAAPQGVNPGAVGADINLSANGSLLIGATTSGGATIQIPVGAIAASVSARF